MTDGEETVSIEVELTPDQADAVARAGRRRIDDTFRNEFRPEQESWGEELREDVTAEAYVNYLILEKIDEVEHNE